MRILQAVNAAQKAADRRSAAVTKDDATQIAARNKAATLNDAAAKKIQDVKFANDRSKGSQVGV